MVPIWWASSAPATPVKNAPTTKGEQPRPQHVDADAAGGEHVLPAGDHRPPGRAGPQPPGDVDGEGAPAEGGPAARQSRDLAEAAGTGGDRVGVDDQGVDDDQEAHRRHRHVVAGEAHQRRSDDRGDERRGEAPGEAGEQERQLRRETAEVHRRQPRAASRAGRCRPSRSGDRHQAAT
jgi:hypothetical protein